MPASLNDPSTADTDMKGGKTVDHHTTDGDKGASGSADTVDWTTVAPFLVVVPIVASAVESVNSGIADPKPAGVQRDAFESDEARISDREYLRA
ncbi:hypothetical protein ONZ51_g13161 [Trametes cubensis]|uniref:Uncharacterized protein n=1 Tax=Trametes cubensis TaxID=1111947 RepID=A0AAD7TEK5_9APHY|nr:hypothetical protein ONZ51_g13161 [Trametes cubensis]